jgi:hypothetical protein
MKPTFRADVLRYAHLHGIVAKGGGGVVMLSKAAGGFPGGLWIDTFDNWMYAREFLAHEEANIRRGTAPAWAPRVVKNPAPRPDIAGAAKLAERFHGRAPEFEDTYEKPTIPDAMANIGAIYAIEYLAERDGKEYRFRHVFKQKSRPQLAVAPDGKFVTMIGGSWRFTEDGFEDS